MTLISSLNIAFVADFFILKPKEYDTIVRYGFISEKKLKKLVNYYKTKVCSYDQGPTTSNFFCYYPFHHLALKQWDPEKGP